VIAGAAAVAIVVALVGALMWYFIEGRPNIVLANGGEFVTAGSSVQIRGRVENAPERYSARVTVGSWDSKTFRLRPDGTFDVDVDLDRLGPEVANLLIVDERTQLRTRGRAELLRNAPEMVQVRLHTSPPVADAEIVLSHGEEFANAAIVRTDTDGVASADVRYGQFRIEASHPRYEEMDPRVRSTGFNATWSGTILFKALDHTVLLRELDGLVDDLMELLQKKVDCDPMLSDRQEGDLRELIVSIRRLAGGDPDIELFLEQAAAVEDCDESTMVERPRLPLAPGVAEARASEDPALYAERLLDRLEELLELIANCPPEPTELQLTLRDSTCDELWDLARSDSSIRRYVRQARLVEPCEPDSLPEGGRPEVPQSLRDRSAQIAGRGVAGASGATGSNGAGGADGGAGGDGANGRSGADGVAGTVGTAGASGSDGRSPDVQALLDQLRNSASSDDPAAIFEQLLGGGTGGAGGGGAAGGPGAPRFVDAGAAEAEAVIGQALARAACTPELLALLNFELELDEFETFVRQNLPTG
ncbi:MAG: hypothetical protein AAFZ65_20800, partial [Planctomycetota bacterium]